MTTREQHEQQARDNLDLYEQLAEENRHLDWELTSLFYAALHYVDAFLLPDDPHSHRRRNQCILARAELRSVYPSYRLLQDRSRDTRYECFDPTTKQLRWYRTEHFDPIQGRLAVLLQAKSGQ